MKADATACATEPEREAQRSVAQKPLPHFDRLAPIYRWMEWASFGPFLCWCRCAFLGEMRALRRALVIGDGDGRFTARLLKTNRALQVDALDASAAMLRALARRAGPDAARVRRICKDARGFEPDANAAYDLIVTHFFLDCLTTGEVRALAQRVRASAAPNAIWVVSEFAIPQGWFGRLVARPIVAVLYQAFGWLTALRQRRLPDHGMALRAAGFELVQRRTWLGGLLVSEHWTVNPELLQSC